MPDLAPAPKPWHVFTPWKLRQRWSRFIGWSCLALIALNVAAYAIPGAFNYIWYPSFAVLVVLFTIDTIRNVRFSRKSKRQMKTLRLWSQALDGKLSIEELNAEDQEAIAIQRAKAYMQRPAGKDDT